MGIVDIALRLHRRRGQGYDGLRGGRTAILLGAHK